MRKILQIYIYIKLFYYLKIIIEQIIESDAISISSMSIRYLLEPIIVLVMNAYRYV